jgi:outer membrane receptor protein involved in Fe transport
MDKTEFNLNPKLGIAVNLGKNGVFRIAYQKRSTPGFDGELAPVGTSGLIPPSFNFLFNAAQDIQTSIEYELTERTFIKTSLGYERLKDLIAAENLEKAQLWYGRVAINQILGRYFSFSVRYNYSNSRYLDGAKEVLRGIPRHSGDARLVFIYSAQIKMWLREAYVGEMFADSQNKVKLEGYFLTDFYAQKEFFKKRISLSFSVLNLFDKRYLTVNHPYYWYEGALPAKGRTFLLQMEYRL